MSAGGCRTFAFSSRASMPEIPRPGTASAMRNQMAQAPKSMSLPSGGAGAAGAVPACGPESGIHLMEGFYAETVRPYDAAST